jgi:hypothetical protein
LVVNTGKKAGFAARVGFWRMHMACNAPGAMAVFLGCAV